MSDRTTSSRPLHVLVGFAEQRVSVAALRQAADLCRRLGAHLDVVHVVDTATYLSPGDPTGLSGFPVGLPPDVADRSGMVTAERQRLAERVSRELDGTPVPWSVHVREGRPSDVLAEMADDVDAYCLVVGTRGEGVAAFLERLLRPSVSHALVGRQHRPVLLVTEPAENVPDVDQ